MNLNQITVLVVSSLSFHVLADRNSDRGGRWGGGQSDSSSTRTESPAPTSRYSAPQATERTFVPSQQAPAERSYTPSQSFRGEQSRTRTEPFSTPEPQRQIHQRAVVTPRQEQNIAPTITQTQPIVQPTQPVAMPRQPTSASRNTFQDVHRESERTSRIPTERSSRERTMTPVAQAQPVAQPTQPVAMPRQPTSVSRTTFPDVNRESERTSRIPTERPSHVTYTQPRESSRTVQIATPKTDRHSTVKESSPVAFTDRSSSRHNRDADSPRTSVIQTSPMSQAQHQAVSLHPSQLVDSRTRESSHDRAGSSSRATAFTPAVKMSHASSYHPETRQPNYNNIYYAHHYPQHHDRPEIRYSNNSAFWRAFGFTLGASMVAPFYMGAVMYPASYSVATWQTGPVTFSVSSRSAYSGYAYRPYYYNTGYIHDGWHYSSAYYGGWRGNWYGGFSYMFNPTPVYSSYYLYDEPQPIVIQQPAQQVVYVNQPAQPNEPMQESFIAPVPAPVTTPPQPALESATAEVQPPPASEMTRCFCACNCNGRVPCICEYACGSEYAYSPDEYTVKEFSSYSESLNKELIWSSYAGLDRAEPEALVAEATE
ncbi:MAG: hypothetical protein WCP12_11795 [bacterium]